MKTDTKEKIIQFINQKGQARAHELGRQFTLSQVAIHKQLRDLLDKGRLVKIGQPPLVYYRLRRGKALKAEIDRKLQLFLEKYYLYISPVGEILSGLTGFNHWLQGINQERSLAVFARRYRKIRQQANKGCNRQGLIDLTKKINSTFSQVYLNKVFCSDFYSLPEFGKTKLGGLVLYAKQSQNRQLIKQIVSQTQNSIKKLIQKFKIEAVVFVPATVPRKLQFLREYRLELSLALPEIQLVKVSGGEVIVAQKTLNRLEERVVNARETILIDERKPVLKTDFTKVLVIDDAVGSGATLNEVAAKLKAKKIAKTVIGYAVVGSFKGFDVIREI